MRVSELALHLETFGKTLNEQKARLAIIGEDAAAHVEAWRAAEESWSDIERSAIGALEQPVPDEQAQISV